MTSEDYQQSQPYQERSYSTVLNEVISSAKDVMRSEVKLFVTEFRLLQPSLTKHITQTVLFGYLLALSALPFLAFLVIGLGQLLDGRSWLSSLIVSFVCAAIGGPLAFSAFAKIKTNDVKFKQTKKSLYEAAEVATKNVDKIKTSLKGKTYAAKSFN